jgi:hypothetical protein
MIILAICSGTLLYNSRIGAVKQLILIDDISLKPILSLQNQEDLEESYMFRSHLQSIMSDEVLGQLQELLLKAILLGQKLPGLDRSIQFPDLPFLLQESTITLIDENLKNSISFAEVPIPIRILSQQALLEEAHTQGDIAYLRFQPSEIEGDTVRLTLEAKVYPHDPNQSVLGLSGIQVTFQRVSGNWQVFREPILFSS